MSTDEELARHATVGAAAWPTLAVPRETFCAYVRERMGGASSERVARLPSADLYLACGCVLGLSPAMSLFFDHYLRSLPAELERARIAPVIAREVQGLLFERATTARPGTTRTLLADYAGSGALRSWLLIVALREAFGILRKENRHASPPRSLVEAMQAADLDPELLYMRAMYRHQIDGAFSAAVSVLSERERNLLRHAYLDALSIDAIGAIYSVHRATAARWVTNAQDRLIAETRVHLRARLAVGDREIDSILRFLGSQIDVSVQRHFAPEDRP